ncbi:MAG: hypothetical protein Q4Q06_05025 [Bacteroidota bacterium]|nr:hypothetical protein [Bacteroidota bacterium]
MKENKDYIIKRLANTLKLAKQELEGDLEQFLNIYLAMEKTQDKEALNKFIETLTSKKKKGIAPKRKRGAQPGNQNARKYRPIPRRKPRQKEEEIDSLFCETSNKVESKENKQVSENTKNANEGKSLVLFEVKQTENKQVSEEYTEFEEISENFKEKEKERKKKNQKNFFLKRKTAILKISSF